VGKTVRGGYTFLWWKGDHGPKHVHVYRHGKFVVKRDLEAQKVMKGTMTGRVLKVIDQLQSEGLL
jgi:hypothetical protein